PLQRLFGGRKRLAVLPLRTPNHRFGGEIALSLLERGGCFVPRVESKQVTRFIQSALCDERFRQRKEEGGRQLDQPLFRDLVEESDRLGPPARERKRPRQLREQDLLPLAVTDAACVRDPLLELIGGLFA